MSKTASQSEDQTRVLLQVCQVMKAYPSPGERLRVLHNVSFEVERGAFFAIIGPSGSGKTTLLSLLGALDRPDSGTICLDGVIVQDLAGDAAADFRREKVGFVFQLFYLLPNLTALENVMVPLLPFRRKLTFDLQERARHLLELVGLSKRLHHLPSRLSGGEQQRVAIARALINKPQVLLADEPTGNLDPRTGADVLSILREIQQTEHQTLVMITHDPHLSEQADQQLDLARYQPT